MRPKPPISNSLAHLYTVIKQWHKTVLTGGLTYGIPTGLNSSGIPNQFEPDNFGSTIIRVGATGAGETYNWPSSNTDYTIAHNLGRVPVGFHLVDPDKAVQIFRGTVAWTDTEITLQITDATANTTIVVF